MQKSFRDFMDETGNNFEEAQKKFQEYRTGSTQIRANINNVERVGMTGVNTAYNPYTYQNETINPNTAVNTGAYSMQNKQQMWEQYGNNGNFEMNAFYRGNDGSLQIKDEYKKTLSNARNLNDINDYFNQSSIEKFENRNINKPTAEGFAKYNEAYGKILTGGQKSPEVYSAVQDMENRRRNYGLDELENQMALLHKEMADLSTNTKERRNYATSKAIPMGAIAGRVSEIEKQGQTRLEYLRNEANYLNDQYKTKMGVIEMFMKAGIGDYERSKQAFDENYRRNRDLLNEYQTEMKTEYSKERERQKDAQATLQTIYNGVINGSIEKNAWTPEIENSIMKMELQAGFPMGMIKSIYNKNPKADIIQQGTSNVNGRQILNVVMRDKGTGKMYVENIDMGASPTPSQNGRYQYKEDGKVFDTHTGRIQDAHINDVGSIIEQCRTTGQCGAGVNDYLRKRGVNAHMEDSYESKKQYINSQVPQVGGLAIWQPSGPKAQPQYGHVGIVVGEQGDKVLIHDWNWDGDEKQKTHWVPKSAIEKNGGYMHIQKENNIKKTLSISEKEQKQLVEDYKKEASRLVGELYKGTYDFDNAHAQLYTRFGEKIKSMGYSDEEVKHMLFLSLGGQESYDQYKRHE